MTEARTSQKRLGKLVLPRRHLHRTRTSHPESVEDWDQIADTS